MNQLVADKTKTCSTCKKTKSWSEYYMHKTVKGIRPVFQCKSCAKAYKNKWVENANIRRELIQKRIAARPRKPQKDQALAESQRLHNAWYGSGSRLKPTAKATGYFEKIATPVPKKVIEMRLFNHDFNYHVIEYLRHLSKFQAEELDELRRRDLNRPENVKSVYFNLKSNCEKITGVSWIDIISSRRPREYVYVRQVCYYLMKKYTTRSLPEIGRSFGGKDHSTVLHGVLCVKASLGECEWPRGIVPRSYTSILEPLEELVK